MVSPEKLMEMELGRRGITDRPGEWWECCVCLIDVARHQIATSREGENIVCRWCDGWAWRRENDFTG